MLADIERIKKSKDSDEIDAIMAKYQKGLDEMDRRNAKNAKAPAKPKTGRYNGKYEVYQAADGYAYRLKASNGEILATSEIYTSRDGVLKAIETVTYLYYNRGNAYVQCMAHQHAIDDYTRAIELDANLAEAYFNRGLARMALKLQDGAVSDLSKAGELGLYTAYSIIKRQRK